MGRALRSAAPVGPHREIDFPSQLCEVLASRESTSLFSAVTARSLGVGTLDRTLKRDSPGSQRSYTKVIDVTVRRLPPRPGTTSGARAAEAIDISPLELLS